MNFPNHLGTRKYEVEYIHIISEKQETLIHNKIEE